MRFGVRALAASMGSGVLLVGLAACGPTGWSPGTGGDRDPVTFVATDFAYEGPASIPAGLTEIELVNEGDNSHGLVLVELGDGRTTDDVLALLGDMGPMPDWISFAGGVGGIPPGARASVVHALQPGRYAVFSFESADGEDVSDAEKGMIQELEVTEPDGTSARVPEADATLSLYDFTFKLTGELESGSQTIAINNMGQEPHEALIMKLSEGVTGAQVAEMITAFSQGGPPEGAGDASPEAGADTADADHDDEGDDGQDDAEGGPPDGPPFTSVGGLPPIDPGETAHLTLDLEPGNYVLLCFLPSATADGAMHMAMGMHHDFTIE